MKPRDAEKVVLVGNPVRAEIIRLGELPFPSFDELAPLKILVTGGSQGASILSNVVPAGLGLLDPSLRRRLQVVQQCRPEDIERVRKTYADLGIPAELMTYIEDMPQKIADAHLVIGRAGASTVAELTAAGRPAILVPFAAATDDHQTANAREMVKAGGARAVVEAELHAGNARPPGRGACRWTPKRCRTPPRARFRSAVPTLRATLPIWSSASAAAFRRFAVGAVLSPRRRAVAPAGGVPA